MAALSSIYRFYRDGFARMSPLGRMLWCIVIVKLVIMFAVLKIFFFPDFLSTRFDTPEERADYVIESLTGDARNP